MGPGECIHRGLRVPANYFTAKRAETANAYPISENSGDSTVQNFPDPLSDFHFRGLEIPGVSLRTNGDAVGTGVLCGSNAMSGFMIGYGDGTIVLDSLAGGGCPR
jgi:hypothetical protein